MDGVNPLFSAAQRRPHVGRWAPLPAWLALAGLLALGPAVVRGEIKQGRESRQNEFAAVLYPSEEATTLMSRARQGIERGDWKLAVDSLQRIIELPGEHILASDGDSFESARRQAQRRIASLPPTGLAAYRLMYDTEAAALLAKAADAHDLALLRSIVDQYLVTSVGDEAAAMLADWLIDEGQFAEAVAVLQLVKGIYPDSDLPQWALSGRLAVCYAGMGRRQKAESILKGVLASRPAGETASTRPGAMPGTAGKPASPRAGDGPTPRDRLARIRAYVERPRSEAEAADLSAWPVAYGRASRDGTLPAVEPSFTESHAWVAPLNLLDNSAEVEEFARRQKILPTASMVADGRLLVVKSGPVLQALDVDTFEVLWRRDLSPGRDDPAIIEATPGGRAGWQRTGAHAGRHDQLDSDPLVRLLLRDSVSAGLSIAGGLVFTLEWASDPPAVLPAQQQLRFWPGTTGLAATHPNRVVAYSLRDGRRVWESNTALGESKLGLVEFLAVPIPVENYLVAPCRVNTDLYAMVLDPATGQVARHIYLCGTGGGPFNSLYALQPCVADGVVYIPTGRGVLVALEASTWTIRWAVRYDSGGEQAVENHWLPTPVIAIADSVLLAPLDADQLFCMDRATGEIRWRMERGDSRYLLGANDRFAWLGGEQVQLVDVETGKTVWEKKLADPSGRGVVAGNRIYLPTVDGLVALDATSGERLQLSPAADELVLGNLLVFNSTLYSTDATRTREFPDLERGYAEALRRHQAEPAEPAHAIRLARLELLRRSPAKALAALEKIPADLKTASPRRYEQANHLQVTAMLELAASGAVPSEQARRLLEEARQLAVSPRDAVDSALALADYHRRENRPLGACLQYLALALSPEGDQVISEGDEFHQRARSLAVRGLADVAKALDTESSAKLDASIRDALLRAELKRDSNTMLWLAESPALGESSSHAELALGRWAVEDLRFEQAEGHFKAVIRRASSPALRAEATARLAALYLQPDELHLPVSAVRLLDRLEHEFASVGIPTGALEVESAQGATTRPAAIPEMVAGADLARELRKRVDPAILARHRAALGGIALGTLGEPTTTIVREARPLLVREGRIEPLADRQLILVDGKKVEARRVENDEVLWPAELRLLNELAIESRVDEMTLEYQRSYASSSGPSLAARGVTDGQTLVVNSAYGVHAIGLLTGRRLWSRRFDPPVSSPQQERAASDAWLWVHDGYVISVSKAGELEVSTVTAGDRLLWSRKHPGRHWYAVRARGPYVVAVDDELQQVDVFRLEDGRYLGACKFKQNAARRTNITLFEDVICGPASDNEVVAMELATPGVERWRVSTDSDLAQLFKPSADLLAVSDRFGRLQLVDPRTGKRHMAQVKVPACANGVMDGTLIDGILYVYGFKSRAQSGADPDQRWGLAAIRVSDSAVLWGKDDLPAKTFLSQDVLEACTNAIPVAVFLTNDAVRQFHGAHGGSVRTGTAGQVGLSVVDKTTGKQIGEGIIAPLESEAGASRILSVEVRPGQVQVTAGAARMRFPFDRAETGHAGSRAAAKQELPAEIDVGRGQEGDRE